MGLSFSIGDQNVSVLSKAPPLDVLQTELERVLSVEYYVDGKTQTLEITLQLGREQPLFADYLYALRSKTDSLSRHKIARLI